MKLNKLFMGIFGVLALTACSTDEIVPEQKPIEIDGEPKYMSVSLCTSNGGGLTRDGEEAADPKKPTFENGDKTENEVYSLRFYFFKANGDGVSVSTGSQGRSYYDCTTDDIVNGGNQTEVGNVEKILNAVIVINSTKEDIKNDIKYMAAIANFKDKDGNVINEKLNQEKLSLKELKALVFSKGELDKANGFILTSSSFKNTVANGNEDFAVEVKETDIKETKDEARNAPVTMHVERIKAKVRVKTAWSTDFNAIIAEVGGLKTVTLKDDATNTKYEAVPLFSKKKKTGTTDQFTYTAITDNDKNDNESKQVYVIFKGWEIWWTANMSYMIKNIGDWGTSTIGDWWNSSTYNRSYWAQNPVKDINDKPFGLDNYTHDEAEKVVLTEVNKNQNYAVDKYSAYCFENAADYEEAEKSGLKRTYDPDEGLTNRTLAYIRGVLVTVDNANVATPLNLVEWAAKRGTEKTIKGFMFDTVKDQIWVRTKPESSETTTETSVGTVISGSEKYTWYAVSIDDVDFYSGLEAGEGTDEKENSPRYRSYLHFPDYLSSHIMVDEATGEKVSVEVEKAFYTKNNDGNYVKTDLAEVNKLYHGIGGAKYWRNGDVYYYHDLQHLNAGTDEEYADKGKYGVVRNHIYDVVLQSVFGLGTPVLSPATDDGEDSWEKIIPQHPDNEYYLGAKVNILSWRVVNNNVNFDW